MSRRRLLSKLESLSRDEISIVLAGNPNVGKSTLFNALTGLRQHTGNWPGKTVDSASGHFSYKGKRFRITDLPGTYSLSARSSEEEITRDQICFGQWERLVLVVDATSLERNLPLVLQVLEITDSILLCVNLMDEAERCGIEIDLNILSERLGIPVVGVTASKKRTITPLLDALTSEDKEKPEVDGNSHYPPEIREAISPLQNILTNRFPCGPRRASWLSLLLLSGDREMEEKAGHWCGEDLFMDDMIAEAQTEGLRRLSAAGIMQNQLESALVFYRWKEASAITGAAVRSKSRRKNPSGNHADKMMNNPFIGYPLMALAMIGVFLLTIRGADLLTEVLESVLFRAGDLFSKTLLAMGCPGLIHDVLIYGSYRMLAWVISVMLPPMLIFFPLFTFLEDLGYLPRVAFSLDRPFSHCGACGKQALTMAMGLGCNAVGVTGCRIIDTPRDRLLAILTNSFVPCSGRTPMLVLITGMFFSNSSLQTALILSSLMVFAVGVTMAATRLLSYTIFHGNSSALILELPPFRRPRLGQILVRSLQDRVASILGRAVAVAMPAGVLIWAFSNIRLGESTLLQLLSGALNSLGLALGMDGAILLAFVLGSTANETVIPIVLMIYSSTNRLNWALPPVEINELLLINGWNWTTAVSVLMFAMFHWPCTTTLLTIRKETGSWKWTGMAALLPASCGFLLCFILHIILTAV